MVIIIITGLRSVSASEDVIEDPSRSGSNNTEILESGRVEREKVLGKRAIFRFNRSGKKIMIAYGGKKCVFRPERNASEVEINGGQ